MLSKAAVQNSNAWGIMLIVSLVTVAPFMNTASVQNNCTSKGIVIDLSWFQHQSIGEKSLVTAYLYHHAIADNSSQRCALYAFSNQNITFFVDGMQFLNSTITNSSGVAKLYYNTSLLGMGNHTIYAYWKNQSYNGSSPVEQIRIVKRLTYLDYNLTRLGNMLNISASLISCDSLFIYGANECRPMSNKTISFYLNKSLIGSAVTNPLGSAQVYYDTSKLASGSYPLLLQYAGDANDTAASSGYNSASVVEIGNLQSIEPTSLIPIILIAALIVIGTLLMHLLKPRTVHHRRKR